VTAAAVILAAILAVAAVLLVARPFLRRAGREEHRPGSDGEALERAQLLDERDRALAALKELEFDHRTGKISDSDYRELVGPLRREAATAIRRLDPPPAESRAGEADAIDAPKRAR
jgi:hypothetical protein